MAGDSVDAAGLGGAAASPSCRAGPSRHPQSRFQKPLMFGRYTGGMHLLLVEDDPRLGDLVARLLGGERHLVERAVDGDRGPRDGRRPGHRRDRARRRPPDLSGLEVARRLRAAGSLVPILMLTARDSVSDRVAGLDSGADDYLVKPFAIEELSARVRALGRRAATARGPSRDPCSRAARSRSTRRAGSCTVDGRPRGPQPREFALLECLLRHRGSVLSRDQLLDHAWPYDTEVERPSSTPTSISCAGSSGRRRRSDRDGPRDRLPGAARERGRR